MNERTIENIKVEIRKNAFLYIMSKFLYLPVKIFQKYRLKREINKKIRILSEELTNRKPSVKRVFYFGVPIHQNLGDTAQMYCIRQWIHHNYRDCDLVEIETWPSYSKTIRKLLKKLMLPDNLIVIESGATFCNIHDDHEMHRYILSEYKNNRVLFMPNTVNLQDNVEMRKTATLFNNHPKAVFLARDPESFNMIKPFFDNNRILLFPDIVTSLIGNISFSEKREGILVCKRIDGEKIYTDSDTNILIQQLKTLAKTDLTDTNFERSPEYTLSHVEEEIFRKLKQFASYDVVLTDRYHGMIFALVANTPVVVLATKGHKVREGALWFMKDYPDSIWFCETPEEAYRQVGVVLSNKTSCTNKSLYKEKYFNNLKKLFDKIV